MRRFVRLALVVVATLVLLTGAGSALATDGEDFGACVVHHATTARGFTQDHNPGMHEGFAGWSGCPDH